MNKDLLRCASILSLITALSGCGSILSGAGPYKNTITSEQNAADSGYQLINLSAASVHEFQRPNPKPVHPNINSTHAASLPLIAGDSLRVLIADNVTEGGAFASLVAGGSVFELRIDPAGFVSIPYAGRFKVNGLTPYEIEQLIRSRLKGIATDPQVMVSSSGEAANSVLVAGAVKAPGRFSTKGGALTLLDAINLGGGPVMEPHLVRVVVRNGKTVRYFDYEDLLAGQNYTVDPRSEIVVERARKRFVAMGAVGKPGLHDLPSENPSLLEVLGSVGGLAERSANPSGVFIFRANDKRVGSVSGTDPQVFQLDMRDPSAIFVASKFLMMPEDAVYVTNAPVYEWQKVISPIVQTLVLGRTIENF